MQRIQIIAIMEVAINSQLYQQASTYAQQQGLNITSVIENFLVRFVGTSKNATEQSVPDVVQSLLGAGEKVAEDDLNAREAYYEYLEEKDKLHVCSWILISLLTCWNVVNLFVTMLYVCLLWLTTSRCNS